MASRFTSQVRYLNRETAVTGGESGLDLQSPRFAFGAPPATCVFWRPMRIPPLAGAEPTGIGLPETVAIMAHEG
jgi:hypothetical protein